MVTDGASGGAPGGNTGGAVGDGDGPLGGAGGACDSPECAHRPVRTHGQLRVSAGTIVGENGQPAQLRGVSTQWLNWEQTYAASEDTLRFLRDGWGLDVFRIANGVENDGGYAMESVRPGRLELVKQIIDQAIALDVYVIVDWHTHELEHLELAKEFFSEIASTYGDQPHLIYEPFNEPIGPAGASAEADYWENELKPYHQQVIAAIREHDPDNVIILGTPRWSQSVDVAAKSPVTGDNLAYTLHFYSCTHDAWLLNKARAAVNAGAALFVTEWGSTHADGGTADNPGVCLEQANVWHDFLDEHSIGSAAWKLTRDGDESALLLPGASPDGAWTDAQLSEHGRYVRTVLSRP